MRKIKMVIAYMLMLSFLTSCSQLADNSRHQNLTDTSVGGDTTTNDKTGNQSQGSSTSSWQADYLTLTNRYDMAVAADKIYGCFYQGDQAIIESLDRQTAAVDNTFTLSGVTYLSGMVADKAGNVYILGNRGENSGLWIIEGDGSFRDFSEMELEDTEEVLDISPKGIFADQRGYLYLWCGMEIPRMEMAGAHEIKVYYSVDRIYVKDQELHTVFYQEIDNVEGVQVLNFQVPEDNSPILVMMDSDGIFTQAMDVQNGTLEKETRLEGMEDFVAECFIYGMDHVAPTDNGFLFCQGNDLYELRYDTQEVEKMLGLSTYGIYASDVLYLTKNKDAIELIDNHRGTKSSEFISLVMGEGEKQVLSLGVTMTLQGLEQVVTEFNRRSNEYRVEIIDYYSKAGNYDDGLEQLKLDVITGKAPDIIDVSNIDYDMFAEKGVLADLYEFMQEDEECRADMLMPSVLKAYDRKGHLYSIAEAFQLYSMWGYGDIIGGQSGVTFGELFQILENSGKDLNAIYGFSADETVLANLCTVSMDEFVDWDNRTCSFDDDYFKEILKFAKEYTGNYTGGTYPERIHKREIVMTVGIISSVSAYQLEKTFYGGDVDFIGYPVTEGSGTAVSFRGSDLAINTAGKNQKGAWEFVKYNLLQGYDGQGFPVVKERFQEVMAAAMAEEYELDELGEAQRIPKEVYSVGGSAAGEYIFVYAATQEEVDAVVELVEGASSRIERHPDIQNIINEEAAAYFSGQVDLDRTAEVIQNRVTVVLEE